MVDNEISSTEAPLAVVVLTYNEEVNLPACLQSVAGWAREIFIVDSWSEDRTPQIAKEFGAELHNIEFKGYAETRNWALEELPIREEWVLFLDADERVTPELREEITSELEDIPAEISGFELKRRFHFLGRWIKHGGYYPLWLVRLVRRSRARCVGRRVNEHLEVEGRLDRLQHDFVHEDKKGLDDWLRKHVKYAKLEALEYLDDERTSKGRLWGSQPERKQWLRTQVWNRLPRFIRPLIYFSYRYVLKRGFMDGKEGLIYHTLQGLWYPFLIDTYTFTLEREDEPGG